jgi:DNA polymerase III epsilon subunit-like protein
MALNAWKNLMVYDFETTGKNPNGCQLTQIAAIMLHGKKLTPLPGGVFNIEVRPEFDDEKAIASGFDPVEQEALDKTRKTREQLEKAVSPKVAWKKFTDFVNKFNTKGLPYYAPIPVGFNINGFDLPILQRYCRLYGPCEEKTGRQKLVHQIHKFDVMDMLFTWFEDEESVKKSNLDYYRGYFGFPEKSLENAHDALYDVIDCANIFIEFMKYHRRHASVTKFEKSFASRNLTVKYEDLGC